MKPGLIFLALFLSFFFKIYATITALKFDGFNSRRNYSRNKNPKDTIFIQREKTADYYHKIYIEKNRKSGYYKLLTRFKFDKDDLETVRGYYKSLKKRDAPIKTFDLKTLSKEWLPLYKYKSHYYLYAPCEWGNTGRKMITKSLLFYWYIDGPYPYLLTSFSKLNPNHYRILSKDFFGNEDVYIKPKMLDIYLIDRKKNISVWAYKDKKEDYRYGLFVAKDHAKDYNIIVNYCAEEKVVEFNFDTIDFKKLIKGK